MKCSIICGVLTLVFIGTFAAAVLPSENSPKTWPCPVDAEFLPCICISDPSTFIIDLDCNDAKTETDLAAAFNAEFPFPDVHSLTIDQSSCQDCNLISISQATFGPVSFELVTIRNTDIETVGEETFGNSHGTLIELRMSNNKLKKFPIEALYSYSALTGLYLDGNQFDESTIIANIESDTLEVLDLSYNPKLSFDSASVVENCPNIKEVYFIDGLMYDVPIHVTEPIGMFTGLQNIGIVSFKSNHISELQSDTIVADQSTFKSVDLSYNEITNVRENFVTGTVPEMSFLKMWL